MSQVEKSHVENRLMRESLSGARILAGPRARGVYVDTKRLLVAPLGRVVRLAAPDDARVVHLVVSAHARPLAVTDASAKDGQQRAAEDRHRVRRTGTSADVLANATV